MILIRIALGVFLLSRCSGPCLRKLFFLLLLFLPLQRRHKWRVIVLLSRSLLNVSPTQIFGQSQEERNVSGATFKKKMLVVCGCVDSQANIELAYMSVQYVHTHTQTHLLKRQYDTLSTYLPTFKQLTIESLIKLITS